MKKKPVRFIRHALKYNAGEVAGFSEKRADELIAEGVAIAFDPDGRDRSASAPETAEAAGPQEGTARDGPERAPGGALAELDTGEPRTPRAVASAARRATTVPRPSDPPLSTGALRALYAERLRRRPDDPYAWAMVHRLIGDRPLRHLPAVADLMRDDHPLVVVQKSAQVGVSEMLVNRALWAADSGYAGRGNVLFVMPTQNQMDDFAQARFDRAIQDSAYLRSRLQPQPPRRKGADSKRLKHLGPGYIYLRGADSSRQIASVDADLVILDEFDQMAEGTLELAQKRLASSRKGRLVIASTPRYPEAGVNALFLRSDRRCYYLPCPHCGLEQKLTWERNVDVEHALVVCRECRRPMDVLAPGRWVAEAPGNDRVHGYHLSRLYSPWADIAAMLEASEATTPLALQEFQNSDLGEVFVPPGSGLTLDVLDRCRRDYALGDYAGQPCFMGVDVGLKLHVVIRERPPTAFEAENHRHHWATSRFPRLWFAGELDHFAELEALIERYQVERAVVDAQPETRQAVEFARRQERCRVWLARYGRQEPGHDFVHTDELRLCRANRTEAIDAMVERFHGAMNELPRDARQLGGRPKAGIGEYYRQLLVPQRQLEQDGQGNWVARWLRGNKADHFAHAEVYCALVAETYRDVGEFYVSGM